MTFRKNLLVVIIVLAIAFSMALLFTSCSTTNETKSPTKGNKPCWSRDHMVGYGAGGWGGHRTGQ